MSVYKTNKATKVITIGGQGIELYEPPVINGVTDGIQFAGHIARVAGSAEFGALCRCGKDKLVNVIAEDEPDENGRKLIVLKCYSCVSTFVSEYPKPSKEGESE